MSVEGGLVGGCLSEKWCVRGASGNRDAGGTPSRGGFGFGCRELGWRFETAVGFGRVKGWTGGGGCSAGIGEATDDGKAGDWGEAFGGGEVTEIPIDGVAGICRRQWEGC